MAGLRLGHVPLERLVVRERRWSQYKAAYEGTVADTTKLEPSSLRLPG